MSIAEAIEPVERIEYFQQPIINLDQVKRRADEGDLLFLEKLTLREAWAVFLDRLFERRVDVRPYHVPWLESRIPELLTKKDSGEWRVCESLGERLLDWYLLQSHNEVSIQALRFAIDLRQKGVSLGRERTKKLFRGLHEGAYWEVPSVDWLVRESLSGITQGDFRWRKSPYYEDAWNEAERAINLIMAAEDVSMIPVLDAILVEHRAGIMQLAQEPYEKKKRFERAKILAILHEALLGLKEMQKEQQPSLTEVVGKPLAKAAKLSGAVLVQLRCIGTVQPGEQGVPVSIQLVCECEDDQPKLAQFVKSPMGFTILPCQQRFERSDVHCFHPDAATFTDTITVVPLPNTTAKLMLEFKLKGEGLATYTTYIRRT